MLKKYEGWFGDFELNPDIDFYGDVFWTSVAEKTYEPDTMIFLENSIDSNTDFIDLGAATGAMSLIASMLGARVLSYEAVPSVYEIAKAHISSNGQISHLIELRNRAISSRKGTLVLGKRADPTVLANISNIKTTQTVEVRIDSLLEEIESFHNKARELVIKIDIEGAEWKILSDPETITCLRRHSALVLLAIHPGFYRPYKEIPFGLTTLTKKYWQFQNMIVAYLFFSRLFKVAAIKRTNLDRVKSPKKCILLMFGGYFEFIVDFSKLP